MQVKLSNFISTVYIKTTNDNVIIHYRYHRDIPPIQCHH